MKFLEKIQDFVQKRSTSRMLNYLKEKQETVFLRHSAGITTVTVTSDNKYIISGSKDKSIRIWNLLEKTKSIFKFWWLNYFARNWQRVQIDCLFGIWDNKDN